MYRLSLSVFLLAVAHHVLAVPTSLVRRQSITSLTTAQIDAFTRYTHYASAGYCKPATTLAWNCGADCQANIGFLPVASGGDGNFVEFWYVGFDPSLGTVIVAHQGTNPSSIVEDLTDASLFLKKPDATLFPGLPSGIEIHNGFADAHARAAPDVLAAVKTALTSYPGASVTLVGHSLGAALALIDSVYLPLHIPHGVPIKVVGYGMPRVGNQKWANYVDANVKAVTHVNNKKDPVPTTPGRFLGFHHASGEVHIRETNEWAACPGQDNPSSECIVGDVPVIFDGKLSDHHGPYNGISMSC